MTRERLCQNSYHKNYYNCIHDVPGMKYLNRFLTYKGIAPPGAIPSVYTHLVVPTSLINLYQVPIKGRTTLAKRWIERHNFRNLVIGIPMDNSTSTTYSGLSSLLITLWSPYGSYATWGLQESYSGISPLCIGYL